MSSVPLIHNEEELKSIAQEALSYAKGKVEYADLLYEKVVKAEANRLAAQLVSSPYSSKSRVQLRLVNEGKKVEIKVGMLSAASLRNAVDKGVKLLKIEKVGERPVKLAGVPNPEKLHYGSELGIDIRKANVRAIVSAVIEGIEAVAANEQSKNKGVKVNPEIWFFTQIEEKFVADAEGLWKTQVIPRTFLQVLAKTRDEEGHSSQTRVRFAEVQGPECLLKETHNAYELKQPVVEETADWIRKSIELLSAKTLTSEQVRSLDYMILHYTTVGVFVHEALGHNFEADTIKSGTSGIVDKDGKARGVISSEIMNIMDGPLIQESGPPIFGTGFGTEFIDDEGVEVKAKLLAEKGHVKDFILNRETAAYFNRQPNGGAWSQLGDPRVCRMSNTYLYPASKEQWHATLGGLLKDVKKGIVLMGTLGGQVSKDGMASNVQIGYMVESGKLVSPVKPSTFGVKTMYGLRYVDGFAGGVNIGDAGFCGKASQTRYVGDGGPTWTRIKNNEYVTLTIQG